MTKRAYNIILLSGLLASCGSTSSIVDNNGGGEATGSNQRLTYIGADKTSAKISESNDGKVLSKDITYRASSAYNSNGVRYDRIEGHQVIARYGKTEVGNADNITSYHKNAQFFSGILTSTSNEKQVSADAVTFSAEQRTQLVNLRKTIIRLNDEFNAIKHDQSKKAEAQNINNQLNATYDILATLVDPEGVLIDSRNLNNSNNLIGNFGWFAVKDGADYSQLSAVYAKAEGVNIADYNSQAKVQATYETKFKGAAIDNGKFTNLTGQGNIIVDFGTNQLNADIDVANSDNSEAGKITFNGRAGANSNGTIFMNATTPKYNVAKGDLKASTNGYAEATLVDNGNSILGNVIFNDSKQVIAGGFGGTKQ